MLIRNISRTSDGTVYSVEYDKTLDKETRVETPYTQEDFNNFAPWKKMRRCNLADNGTVTAYLEDANYMADGTNGEVMVEIPKFWYKWDVLENGYRWSISPNPKVGFEVHPAFFRDRNGDGIAEEVEARYWGAYESITYDTVSGLRVSPSTNTIKATWKMTSRSNTVMISASGIPIESWRTLAGFHGVGWGISDWFLMCAIQLLYLVEYANLDSFNTIGSGLSGGTSYQTGFGDALGNRTGSFNRTLTEVSGVKIDGTYGLSYRGIEHFMGHKMKIIDGIYTNYTYNAVPLIIKLTNVGFNSTGAGYPFVFDTGVIYPSAFTGFITDIHYDFKLGFFPRLSATGTINHTTKFHSYFYIFTGGRAGVFWGSSTNEEIPRYSNIFGIQSYTGVNNYANARLAY